MLRAACASGLGLGGARERNAVVSRGYKPLLISRVCCLARVFYPEEILSRAQPGHRRRSGSTSARLAYRALCDLACRPLAGAVRRRRLGASDLSRRIAGGCSTATGFVVKAATS
jgi:hypothetical protein